MVMVMMMIELVMMPMRKVTMIAMKVTIGMITVTGRRRMQV